MCSCTKIYLESLKHTLKHHEFIPEQLAMVVILPYNFLQ